MIDWWTRSSSPSPTRQRCRGCFRGFHQLAAASRFHLSWSLDFVTASSHTSASTGTRRLCLSKSVCLRPRRSLYLGRRLHIGCLIQPRPDFNGQLFGIEFLCTLVRRTHRRPSSQTITNRQAKNVTPRKEG